MEDEVEDDGEEQGIEVYHIVPVDGPEHFDDPTCWCMPTLKHLDPYTHAEVWAHNMVH
jgi:hypothetical protein